MIIGSIITFAVIKTILYLNYNKYSKDDYEGVLIFKPDDVNLIKHGKIKQIIKPDRDSNIKPGSVYKAKLNIMSDQHFSELLIKNIYSKKLRDLTEKDIILTGATSKKDFKSHWANKYGDWDPRILVKIIRFDPLFET